MDEHHIEAAYRHADHGIWEPWHGLAPDEELMRKEEGPDDDDVRADAQEALFCYVFEDGAMKWQRVAARALTVMRRLTPGLLAARVKVCGLPSAVTLEGFQAHNGSYRLDELTRLVDGAEELVERLLDWIFPPAGGPGWIKDGCRRLYLVARAYQPDLVRINGKDAGYEDFARVFGELDGGHPDEGARARSRWSARAQNVLRLPILAAGGKAPDLFGKSSTVRGKYQAAAKGNQNRRKMVIGHQSLVIGKIKNVTAQTRTPNT